MLIIYVPIKGILSCGPTWVLNGTILGQDLIMFEVLIPKWLIQKWYDRFLANVSLLWSFVVIQESLLSTPFLLLFLWFTFMSPNLTTTRVFLAFTWNLEYSYRWYAITWNISGYQLVVGEANISKLNNDIHFKIF